MRYLFFIYVFLLFASCSKSLTYKVDLANKETILVPAISDEVHCRIVVKSSVNCEYLCVILRNNRPFDSILVNDHGSIVIYDDDWFDEELMLKFISDNCHNGDYVKIKVSWY